MPFLSDADVDNTLKAHKNILVWGPPVHGKTYSLHTLAAYLKQNELGPIHLYDLDRKCESLVKKARTEGTMDHVRVWQLPLRPASKISTTERTQKHDLYLEFIKAINLYYEYVDPRTGGWKDTYENPPGAIVVDSLTALQEIILTFVLKLSGHDIGDKGTDARQDFGKQMGKIMETIQSLKALPCIFVCTAHEQTEKDDVVGGIFTLPKVTGKLSHYIAGEFNSVLYTTTKNSAGKTEYKWLVRPKNRIKSAGSTHSDTLPDEIPQDFRELFK